MSNRRIKVFLSGIVNLTNAQNLNCRALLEHLNPEKFNVRALTIYSGNLSIPSNLNNHYLPIRYPARLWHPLQLIHGIIWSDVAYLCKPEYWLLQRFLIKFFSKKAFRTIEGVYIGSNLDKAKATYGSLEEIHEACSFSGHTFSITEAMKKPNEYAIGLKTEDKVLYLGAETEQFSNNIPRKKLTDIAIIGGNLYYKGLNDFLEIAKQFPQLRFHVIGSGMGNVDPKAEVDKLALKNVICHGSLDHAQMSEILKTIQLHIFPSRAEGFPKVTLETAAAGIPSLVYGDYGAAEWIEHGKSGFIVNTLDEMIAVVHDLINHPDKLQSLADNAMEIAKRFDWKVIVKDWEKVIEELYEA